MKRFIFVILFALLMFSISLTSLNAEEVDTAKDDVPTEVVEEVRETETTETSIETDNAEVTPIEPTEVTEVESIEETPVEPVEPVPTEEIVTEPVIDSDPVVEEEQEPTISETTTENRVILHTNDIHGRLVEEEGRVIGMPKVDAVKEEVQPDLMLDAGDAFQGLPLSNNSKGEEMAKALNEVGYDAMTVGNHEFDFGYEKMLKLRDMLNFPMISSNIYKDGKKVFDSSVIIERNNLRYGIIGVTTPETATKTNPNSLTGVTFGDPYIEVSEEMKRIGQNVDLFVILSHLGMDIATKVEWRSTYLTEKLLPLSMNRPIITIDGHSHTVLRDGILYNNGLVSQTGTALQNIGRIDFNFNSETKEVSDLKASLINVADTIDVVPTESLELQVEAADDAFKEETDEVVGTIPFDFEGEREDVRIRETNLGNAVADAIEHYALNNFKNKTDFAITNGGGIRASINKGDVTEYDVIKVLPFGNLIAQIGVTGQNIWDAFETGLAAPTVETEDGIKLEPNGAFLHISDSIRVYYNIAKDVGKRVSAIQVLNRATGLFESLDLERIYYVAMNDFMASGGDGYVMFGGPREEGLSLDRVFMEYLGNVDLSKYNVFTAYRYLTGMPPVVIDETEIIIEENDIVQEDENEKEPVAVITLPNTEDDEISDNKKVAIETSRSEKTHSLVYASKRSEKTKVSTSESIQTLPNTGVKEQNGVTIFATLLMLLGVGLLVRRTEH